MSLLQPKPGFEWGRVKWGGPLDPVSDACSYCSARIPEEAVPLRFWTEQGHAAVFCDPCSARWFGLEVVGEPGDEPPRAA